MSMPGAEDTVGEGLGQNAKGTTSASDRRAGKSRVSFEALVAVGDANGAGGFEAESVDVSQTGMRLRTAYLPDVGEKLLCRFEGDVGEIIAEGEVTWRREASRGGEFGLRFTKFETPDAEATLRTMCAKINGTADPSAGPIAIPGTRVRLHIEGLGSPMKARVRDSLGGEIQVGSNLEFLKVGRALELEDMDHGDKRPATVDAVKVEIDAQTKIPQLVVSLRFDGQDAKKLDVKETAKDALNTLGAIARRATKAAEDRSEAKDGEVKAARLSSTLANAAATLRPRSSSARTSLPSVPARSADEKPAERLSKEDASVEATEARTDGSATADEAEASSSGKKDMGAAVRNAAAKASGSAKAAMGAVGPAMGRFGARAKGAVSGLLDSIRKRREVNVDQEGQTFRRTTSAPPTGALRAAGRKLIRDREEGDVGGAVVKTASRRKAALVGGALGLVAVLTVVASARLMGSRYEVATDAQSPEANASAVAAALPAATAPGADGTATPVANVPLFGATPLSTTEPVPAMPTQPDGTMAPAPGAAAAVEDSAGSEAAGQEAGSGDDDDADDDAKGDGKQFGHGNVRTPIVLKVKTDGDIETVNGAAGAMGFTISLPGRRVTSKAASEFMRKDKRIASLNIVNNPTGAEISVQFKDGVPAYMAKAKGSRLDIALGTDAKKVAKAGASSKKGSKKSTKKSAKKGAKKH
jgi:PilZ domain